MWCAGKSDNLVAVGRGDLVVFRSQVGSGDDVVHVGVVVVVLLSHRRQTPDYVDATLGERSKNA